MKNMPNKVIRANKKKPNRSQADDPRQDLRSKASTKRGVGEAEELARAEPTTGYGGCHNQTMVSAMAVAGPPPPLPPGCFGFS